MINLPLRNGGFTSIDNEDLTLVKPFKWRRQPKPSGKSYAITRLVANGKATTLRMHRLIMHAAKNAVVDHINHDGLDNRKANLRIVSVAKNNYNRRKLKLKTSKFKGVHQTELGYWKAGLRLNYKQIHLGTFDSQELAAAAYNHKARQVFGQHACLNAVPKNLEAKAVAISENPKKKRDPKSKYLGVYLAKVGKRRWFVRARTSEGKLFYVGSYFTELEAAKAYNAVTLAIHGASAKVNKL
jgi:AP2 domain.